jgi:UDP-glucose 4-epimerase
MSKIVVLGGNGFIGKHLIRSLASQSDNEVVAFDRFSAYAIGGGQPFSEFANVEIVVGDFFNRSDLEMAIEGADYVFHLVSTTTPASSDDDPYIDIEIIRGSVELFEICAEKSVKRVIFLSSGGTVYGDVDSGSIGEAMLPTPRSPYGIAKLTIEHYLRYFKFTSGLDYIVYRVANPFGPGQNIHGKQGVVPIFLNKVLRGKPVTIFGNGQMSRDFFYIDDLIKMLTASYSKPHEYDEYNLGGGVGTTVAQLVEIIEKCVGHKIEKSHIDPPPTYVDKSVLDISRFKSEFGLTPKTGIEEGIKRTWDYVKGLS